MTTECDTLAALPTEQLFWLDSFAFRPYLLNRRNQVTLRQPIAPAIDRVHGSVAVIDVKGILVRDSYWSDEISTRALSGLLKQAAEDDAIAAVILNIDSPGGTVSGMAELIDAANALANKKPLIAQVDDFCCSAAYELACSATKIFAGRRTTVGSIGTRVLLYDFSKLFEKEGIEAVAIDTGDFKSLGAFGTEITEKHREYLQRFVNQAQEDFKGIVQQSRGLTGESYEAIADGRVFWAEEALGLGLIDGVHTLAKTIQAAQAIVAQTAPLTQRSKRMSQDLETVVVHETATLAELKDNLPGASSEFLLEQLERKATLPQAMKAYFAVQKAENERLAIEATEAIAKVEAAEKKAAEMTTESKTPPQKKRGNQAVGQGGSQDAEDVDYRQLAREYQAKHKCRWSEACLAIKKQYPESRVSFGAPPIS